MGKKRKFWTVVPGSAGRDSFVSESGDVEDEVSPEVRVQFSVLDFLSCTLQNGVSEAEHQEHQVFPGCQRDRLGPKPNSSFLL